jgi:hypothetical protein
MPGVMPHGNHGGREGGRSPVPQRCIPLPGNPTMNLFRYMDALERLKEARRGPKGLLDDQ